MTWSRGDERGAAAVEAALCLLAVLALTALLAPLPVLLDEKADLEQATGRVVRWATGVPAGVRPQRTQAQAEGEAAFRAAGGRLGPENLDGDGDRDFVVTIAPDAEPAPWCATGRTRTVTLATSVSLGVFGDILAAAGITAAPDRTLSASATSCEE